MSVYESGAGRGVGVMVREQEREERGKEARGEKRKNKRERERESQDGNGEHGNCCRTAAADGSSQFARAAREKGGVSFDFFGSVTLMEYRTCRQ